MNTINLQGYYNEETLQDLLASEQIDHLAYIFHHSEEKKKEFEQFCKERNLQENEQSAQQFFDYINDMEEHFHDGITD